MELLQQRRIANERCGKADAYGVDRRSARTDDRLHDPGEQQWRRAACVLAAEARRMERLYTDGPGVSDLPVFGRPVDGVLDGLASGAGSDKDVDLSAHAATGDDPVSLRAGGEQLPVLSPGNMARVWGAAAHRHLLSGCGNVLSDQSGLAQQGGRRCRRARG